MDYLSESVSYVLKYLLWRPLGKALFNHTLAFEDMPLLQAASMFGCTLSYTHSKMFFSLTYAYDWRKFCAKTVPVFRLGVLGGTAQSAGMFMMSQKKHSQVQLLAVASRNIESGKACAKKYDLPIVYCPYELLLSDSNIEGIVVFTPISTHEKLIMNILESGKHCILIPPMAANKTQVKRVLSYKSKHPNLLCVSVYAALAHPVNHNMRDLIRSGTIGEVQKVIIKANLPAHAFNSKSIQFNYDCAGGAWEDLGPHAITLARFMLGDTYLSTTYFKVKSAAASIPTFADNVDETMNTTLFYGNIHIAIEVSLVKPTDTSIEIKGTEGTLKQTQWYRAELFNKLIHRKPDGTTTITEYQGKGTECSKTSWEYTLDYLVQMKTPPFGSCEEELRTMEIVDRVYQSVGLGERSRTV